jgi:hypothetical protein
MTFFFGCLFSTWIGNMTGWAICRNLLYKSSWTVCVVVCFAWGIGAAYALHLFILHTHPGLLLKIFGYGAGAYVSVPNYGLLDESSIPDYKMPRHVFIKGAPQLTYSVASIILAFSFPEK